MLRSQVVQEDSDEPEWVEAVLKVVLVDGWLQAHLHLHPCSVPAHSASVAPLLLRLCVCVPAGKALATPTPRPHLARTVLTPLTHRLAGHLLPRTNLLLTGGHRRC